MESTPPNRDRAPAPWTGLGRRARPVASRVGRGRAARLPRHGGNRRTRWCAAHRGRRGQPSTPRRSADQLDAGPQRRALLRLRQGDGGDHLHEPVVPSGLRRGRGRRAVPGGLPLRPTRPPALDGHRPGQVHGVGDGDARRRIGSPAGARPRGDRWPRTGRPGLVGPHLPGRGRATHRPATHHLHGLLLLARCRRGTCRHRRPLPPVAAELSRRSEQHDVPAAGARRLRHMDHLAVHVEWLRARHRGVGRSEPFLLRRRHSCVAGGHRWCRPGIRSAASSRSTVCLVVGSRSAAGPSTRTRPVRSMSTSGPTGAMPAS